jgi:Cd2+/Zn2+-exporting ATPase
MAVSELGEVGATPWAALRYRVEGMDCPSCASKIETAVGRVPGAEDIRVNYGTQILAFRLDEAATPRSAVEDQVRRIGYGIAAVEGPQVVPGSPSTAAEPEILGLRRKLWWKGAKARLAAILGSLTVAGFVTTLNLPPHWSTGPICPPPCSASGSSAVRPFPLRAPGRRSASRC